MNTRRFYGNSRTPYVSKCVQLPEAMNVATSSSSEEVALVVLPPEDGHLSEEE